MRLSSANSQTHEGKMAGLFFLVAKREKGNRDFLSAPLDSRFALYAEYVDTRLGFIPLRLQENPILRLAHLRPVLR